MTALCDSSQKSYVDPKCVKDDASQVLLEASKNGQRLGVFDGPRVSAIPQKWTLRKCISTCSQRCVVDLTSEFARNLRCVFLSSTWKSRVFPNLCTVGAPPLPPFNIFVKLHVLIFCSKHSSILRLWLRVLLENLILLLRTRFLGIESWTPSGPSVQ